MVKEAPADLQPAYEHAGCWVWKIAKIYVLRTASCQLDPFINPHFAILARVAILDESEGVPCRHLNSHVARLFCFGVVQCPSKADHAHVVLTARHAHLAWQGGVYQFSAGTRGLGIVDVSPRESYAL